MLIAEPTVAAAGAHRAAPVPTEVAHWGGVFAMTLCVFALIASEFMPVSLLTPIASALGVSEGSAGQGIAISGAFAVFTSLSISRVSQRLDRKTVLLSLTALMGISGAVVGLAQGYSAYMAGRALIGVVVGGFWSMSAATAMQLVPKASVPRALATFNGGNALATVVAAPLGSYLGAVVGWRGAFFCLVPIAAAAFVWQCFSLPSMPPKPRRPDAGNVFRLLKRRQVALGMLAVGVFFMGQFALFTYLRPFLETVTRVGVSTLSLVLLALGLAGFVGTTVVGIFLKRSLYGTLALIPLAMAAIAIALVAVGASLPATAMLLAGWGLVATAAPVGWWTWLARTLPDDADAGGGLMVAIVQLSIALGSTVGGVLFDRSGHAATFAFSAGLLLVAAGLAWLTRRADAQSFNRPPLSNERPRRLGIGTRMNQKTLLTAGCLAMLQAGAGHAAVAQGDPAAPAQEITRAGTQASTAGPPEFFTGRVRVDPVWPADEHLNASGGMVTFEPGARSAWHTHPAGQRLVVVSGVGLTQEWGKPVQVLRPGDVVWCPPGVKHWHGAGLTTAMTHLAVTGTLDGKNVSWMEKVSDEQYNGRVAIDVPKEVPAMNASQLLPPRQRSIPAIAAAAALGDMPRLDAALDQGLDDGLTVSEAKEILVHLYAYAGFPRSLNALGRLMKVLDARQQRGVQDAPGREPGPVPSGPALLALGTANQTKVSGAPVKGPLFEFAPAIDQYLKAHLFGDMFARDNLDWQSRELATLGALAALTGAESQLASHVRIAMNVGLTAPQLQQVSGLLAEAGQTDAARRAAAAVAQPSGTSP